MDAIVGLSLRAKNIFGLVDASELLEFFYDEECEIGVLRCLPCFKLHQAAKPTISSLSPFQAQRILNPSSNGTLGSGILLKKEITHLLINGQNQMWYRQKKACIDHLCLLGDGLKLHKSSMEMYRREAEITKKKASAASNIFRAAISDLKLGAAATFTSRHWCPCWLVALWTLVILVTVIRILTPSFIAWRKR